MPGYEIEYSISYIDKKGKLAHEVFMDAYGIAKFLNDEKISDIILTYADTEEYYEYDGHDYKDERLCTSVSLRTISTKEDLADTIGIHYCEEYKTWS
jgi:hypothetical protein